MSAMCSDRTDETCQVLSNFDADRATGVEHEMK